MESKFKARINDLQCIPYRELVQLSRCLCAQLALIIYLLEEN